jgi:CheY-like chemotaxis protein
MLRILLAEDSHFSVRDFSRKLATWDESYELIVVRDGQAALELLDPESPSHLRRQPDLVMLDLKMPRIDGLEVLGFIRENAATRDLPVVVLTTSDSPFDMDLAEVLHVDDYLLKGTDAKTICRVVGRNVRRSGAGRSEPEAMLKAIGDFPYGETLGGRR